jgi:hypothetical protein
MNLIETAMMAMDFERGRVKQGARKHFAKT